MLARTPLGSILALLLCLGSLAGAAEAGAEERFAKAIWGPIQLEPGQGQCGGPDRCSAFPYYKELGVDVFQFQIEWNEVAHWRPADPRDPADPAYWWSRDFDLAVADAARHGIELAVMIRGSPPWANGGHPPNSAPRPGPFADFAVAAARRYPSIDIWMVWGEPTRTLNFAPQGREGARRYARILDAAYGALKGVERDNIVVGGMTLSGGDTLPPNWIRQMRLKGNRAPRMDWFGHNPYQKRIPRLRDGPVRARGGLKRGLSDIDTLWREIHRSYAHDRGRAKPPRRLWLSEFTVQTDRSSWAFPFYVTRAEQARRLRRSFAVASKVPYVRGLGWFSLTDYPPGPNTPTWGLMSYGGERKPAYGAYRALP